MQHRIIKGLIQERIHINNSTKQARQKICEEKRVKQKSCFSMKIIEMIHRENVELTLAAWLETVKELKCKIR